MAVALSFFARDDASAAMSRGGEKKKKKKNNSYQQDVVVSDRKSALTGVCGERDTLQGCDDTSNLVTATCFTEQFCLTEVSALKYFTSLESCNSFIKWFLISLVR